MHNHHSGKKLLKQTAKLEKELAERDRQLEIEKALEKVRSRTMAMKKSEELQDTTLVLFQQFKSLKVTTSQVSICVFDEDTKMGEMFVTLNGKKIDRSFPMELDKEVFVMKKAKKAFLDGQKKFLFTVKGKELQDYNHWRNKLIGKKGWDESKAARKQSWHVNGVFFSRGLIGFSSGTPAEPEALRLLDRFAAVFDLTFTRFLDLQKAEAQAREAQLEAALEKVRARTMGMQRSDELKDAAALLFQQVKGLGVPAFSCGYSIWEIHEKVFTSWMSRQGDGGFDAVVNVPLTEDANFIRFAKSRKKGEQFFILEMSAERNQKHYQYLKTIPGFKAYFEHANKVGTPLPKTTIHHVANFSHGNLLFITLRPCPEFHDVFKRFAAVFDQTYTRFLDLQKAEAQAREAQIEAALERIRAASMAMHHSVELHAVADILFQQVRNFGGNILNAGIALCKPGSDEDEYWLSSDDGLRPVISIPHTEDPIQKKLHEGWQNKSEFYSEAKEGDELRSHYEYMTSVPHLKSLFTEGPGWSFPTWQKWHAAYFSHGYLFMITLAPYEEEKILVRFAKVFQQAYTRFLDLQKAEAQAREAQIELALERVRAKTMAMKKQDDLIEVITLLAEQLIHLGFDLHVANFSYGISEGDWDLWIFADFGNGMKITKRALFPWIDHPFFRRVKLALDRYNSGGSDFSIEAFTKEEKDAWLDYTFTQTEFRDTPLELRKFPYEQPGYCWSGIFLKETWVAIGKYDTTPFTAEQNNILRKFGNAFGQAYTRFLDLQKAEAQAREAQIETALEKIRSRSLAMHRSDELKDVVAILFEKLKELGLDFDGTGIQLFTEGSKDSVLWIKGVIVYSPVLVKHPYEEETFKNSEILSDIWEAKETAEPILNKSYSFEEKNKLIEYVGRHNAGNGTPPDVVEKMVQARSYIATFIMEKNSGLWIDSWSGKKITIEEFNVSKRIAKVFEQAYIRFLDLQRAEAQSRESQIQLALERVRARTMAMHNSSELAEVAALLFEQAKQLGIESYASGFNIWDDEHKNLVSWMSSPTGSVNPPFAMPIHSYDQHQRIYESWKNKDEFIEDDIVGEALVKHYKFLRSFPLLDKAFSRSEMAGIKTPDRQVHNNAHFSKGYLLFITSEPCPQFHSIFKRFARVFEQTYTRFLDLQKAEAQAREAQIELGLERVRTRAMAMQKSDELKELIGTVFTELTKLDLVLTRCIIWVFEPSTNGAHWWMANVEEPSNPQSFYLKYHEHPAYLTFLNGWKNQNVKFLYDLKAKDKEDWDEILFNQTELKHLPEVVKNGMRAPKRVLLSASFNNFGGINVASLEPLSDEHFEILLRFAKVFDLTYTRFLDLQKAEAQARESQIEAALERVRSRTMAMHRSAEIADIVGKIFGELRQLDLILNRVLIWIFNPDERYISWWSANPEVESNAESYRVDYNEHPVFLSYLHAWQERLPLYLYTLSGENKKTWENHLFTNTELSNLPIPVQRGMRGEGTIFTTSTTSDYGLIMVGGFEPLTEANADIIQRFGRVFQQSYTRYLDVQKAEAQARESQIQLALERVRARTMAMQRSDELPTAANLLFHQIQSLGMPAWSAGYCIWDEDKNGVTAWMSSEGVLQPPFHAPLTEDPLFIHMKEAYERGETFFVDPMGGESLVRHYQYMRRLPVVGKILDSIIETGHPLPTFQIMHMAYFSNGFLLFITYQPVPEAHDIFKRFAIVFDQTYTRFLDLTKAEAQVRESQIQLALERVRARTMAMHQSVELAETAQVLFHQLRELGGIPDRIAIGVLDESAGLVNFWSTDQSGTHIDQSFKARLNEEKVMAKTYQAWKDHERSLVIDLHGDDVKEWIQFAREEMGVVVKDEHIKDRRVHNFAFFSHGWILVTTHEPQAAETIEILERFASVFNLTYRRFLDLQKAEAQAKEAHIEAALERVRSRSLAMHKSDELSAIAKTMFDQLRNLGLELEDGLIIMLFRENSNDQLQWPVFEGIETNTMFLVPAFDHPIMNEVYKAREAGVKFIERHFDKTIKDDFLKKIFSNTDYRIVPVELQDRNFAGPYYHYSFAMERFSGILMHSYTRVSYPAEYNDILRRFARVFEQAYVRFLDLQKAEVQAREAQIEAALERVRAHSMAMHQSSDLHDVIKVITEQLSGLGLKFNAANFAKTLSEGGWDLWLSTPEQSYPSLINVPYIDHRIFNNLREVISQGTDFFTDIYDKEEKDIFIRHFFENTVAKNSPEERKQFVLSTPGLARSLFLTKNIWFSILNYDGVPFSDEENGIFKRFANAFEQSYTRFLDLQKAEAQAREAQIEASLERVRSKTMAMHNSNDVGETVATMFAEFAHLAIQTNRCGILIFNDQQTAEVWTARSTREGNAKLIIGKLDLDAHKLLRSVYNAWKAKGTFYQYDLLGEDMVRYYTAINDSKFYPTQFDLDTLPPREFHSDFFFSDGAVFSFTNEPIAEEHSKIMKRFAGVFGQTYRRYLDLQKAEAQAREAQIETALERVRSRTMAMHQTSELQEVIHTLHNELLNLKLSIYGGSFVVINANVGPELTCWGSGGTANTAEEVRVPHFNMPFCTNLVTAIKNGPQFFTEEFSQNEKKEFFTKLFDTKPWAELSNEQKEETLTSPGGYTRSVAVSKHTTVFIINHHGRKFTEDENDILKRFAKVFEQTYTRFLDLQKAEAQAREAQIEAGLERVRARTMAMHSSDDVSVATATMFTELEKLGIENFRGGITNMLTDRTQHVWSVTNLAEGKVVKAVGSFNIDDHPFWQLMFKEWEAKSDFLHYLLAGQEKEDYVKVINTTQGYLSQALQFPDVHFQVYFFNEGAVWTNSLQPHSEEEKQIMKRFTSVFSLTFRRYQDLKKAEAQAREATIEAALERVRYRAMAMQTSKDVGEATSTMFVELDSLGIETFRCGIAIVYEDEFEVWSMGNTGDGRTVKGVGRISPHLHPLWVYYKNEWKKKSEVAYYYLTGKEKDDYVRILTSMPTYNLSDVNLHFPDLHFQGYYFEDGGIFTFSLHPHSEADKHVMKRFANVFALTFRRYRDLEKAEAQAREAQVEAGLERVRARTMAMHNSTDVTAATITLFNELKNLAFENFRCGVTIISDDQTMEVWSITGAADGNLVRGAGKFDMGAHRVWKKLYEGWKNKEEFIIDGLAGSDKEDYVRTLNANAGYLSQPNIELPDLHIQGCYFSEGCVWSYSLEPATADQLQILKRFTAVFSLTFRRYQDLVKAEAQAKEAQIEASLERVRARAMAMHNSQDLTDTIGVFYRELQHFSITPRRCGVGLLENEQRIGELFTWNTTEQGEALELVGKLKMEGHPVLNNVYDNWLTQTEYHPVLRGNEIKEYYQVIRPQLAFPDYDHDAVQYGYFFFFKEGGVYAWTQNEMKEDELQIYRRFTSVLSLTYKRYKDLKQAEANAREATIEAALEKVRGKAMAMHNSNDLSATASMVFTELRKLGINPIRCGVGLLSNESLKAPLYSATSSEDGDHLSLVGWVMLEGHPVLEKIYGAWLKGEDYFPQLQGEELRSYYAKLLEGLSVPVPDWKDEQIQYGHFIAFKVGCLYAWSDHRYNEDEIKILKRFATIIDLTFRRYMELQQSEANAREAVKQAALDRVRADIASMRTVADLDRITPLIWNELTVLGLPFIRCGVFIMDDSQKLIHTFLSTPDGKAIGAFHLPYDTPGNFPAMIGHWRDKKIYLSHWNESDFAGIAGILVEQGAIATKEQYLSAIPPSGVHLHCLPFLQGMLYVGNTEKLNGEQIELIQHVADAFSTAYARYEDFNRLEAAKQQVEKTLVDLKQAQTQLVQSEKMASLGELTAGIAHEIQNPLNFVNNFSDVSNELLDEMKEELAKGNVEDAMAIAEDVKQNLEKINHHGKRADGIVKGMLQHSRTSTGQKEMTDINALADEYLRLAYHGLRAKDKSFNAKFITDFDNGVGKINIIPQDFGRVILNLINNAFYAVSEKKKKSDNGYEPTVTITTRSIQPASGSRSVQIKVTDNGGGISQKNLDKIFQPFFTTKPTGQGTGLGLSLAYDIVKAHGGEIRVGTKESEGSEFIVQLPLTSQQPS